MDKHFHEDILCKQNKTKKSILQKIFSNMQNPVVGSINANYCVEQIH